MTDVAQQGQPVQAVAPVKEPGEDIPRHRIGHFRATARLGRDIWRNRRQIMMVFWRDFNAPHKRNLIGVVWAYIMPILPVSAFIFLRAVLQVDPRAEVEIHPVIYVAIGVTLWLVIRDAVMTPNQSLTKYRALMASAGFPPIGAILVGFGNVMLETLIRAVVCAVAMALLGGYSFEGLFIAVVTLTASVGFFFSLGLMLVPVSCAFPDIENILEIFSRYMIFFCGVIWPVPILFGSDALYSLNPISLFIVNIRAEFVVGAAPDPQYIWPLVAATPILFIVALRMFYVLEPQIREYKQN